MASNIQVQRICEECGKEFTARTTKTRYCSHKCNSRAYKAKIRNANIEGSNRETIQIKVKPITELNAKEFLTVKDVATLLGSSHRTIYRLIGQGVIKAINLSERKTLVKRSELDKLFDNP